MMSNKNDIGYLGFNVFKNCNGTDTKLFSTFNSTNAINGLGVAKTYIHTYKAPFLNVIGCYLKVNYWLNVTSAGLSINATATIVHDSKSWIQFPDILDIIPPTYSIPSTSSTTAGINISHSLYWQDNVGLAGYVFSFDNGTGTFVNDSFVQFSGKANWSNVTKRVPSTAGLTIRWCIYAKDTSNNWNETSCINPFSYVIVQAPHLIIEKKVEEFKIIQNTTFSIEILFHNEGGTDALGIILNDTIPPGVMVNDGDTFWSGQLQSDE